MDSYSPRTTGDGCCKQTRGEMRRGHARCQKVLVTGDGCEAVMRGSAETQKVWEENWEKNKGDTAIMVRELFSTDSLAWKRIFNEVKSHFAHIRNLKVIEIGAGIGRAGARLAREGADVSLVDFSTAAISKAKDFFKEAGLRADFLVCDVFALSRGLKANFDLSVSFGLVEHFGAGDRKRIFSVHAEVLKKGGMAVIGAPNAYGIPYIFWMALAKLVDAWEVGYERPYTAGEINSIMKNLGYNYRRFGTPFTETINTYIINKLNIIFTNLICFKRLRAGDKREKVYKFIPHLKDCWSILDNWLGYHIVFIYK